jgi:O-antigen/teichoic acid export membrane protein
MLLLFLPLLYTPLFQTPITLRFFLQAQLFCTAIATSIAAVIVVKKGWLGQIGTEQQGMSLLKSVAPYAMILLTMGVHNRLDGFLLERLHPNGAYEAGMYAASYRLLDAANMVGYLVASFLVPFLARHRENTLLVEVTVLTARHGLLLFGCFVTLFLIACANAVQQALYPASGAYAAQVLQWCLPVLPAYLLLQVYGSLLTAMGQLQLFIRLLVLSVFVNAVLNVLLVPYWGAVGCCIAALASQYLCAGSIYIAATQKNRIAHGTKEWLQLALAALLLGTLFYFGRQQAVPVLLLFAAGGTVAVLALITYLPVFKRYALSR